MTDFNWTAQGGKSVTNYEVLGAVAAKVLTVPAGKRWYWFGLGSIERDASATLNITVRDENDKALGQLFTAAASASLINLPLDLAAGVNFPQIFEAGWDVVITWGATQTTPEISFTVLEVDV